MGRRSRNEWLALVALVPLGFASALQSAGAEPLATFEALGPPYTDALEVSADGSGVVGATGAPGVNVAAAFRWTAEEGWARVADGIALGASADGSVLVGEMDSPGHSEAFRWTEATGAIGLGVLPGDVDSVAFDTSADGSVVVGYSIQDQASGWRATGFRWTEAGGMVDLGPAPGGAESLPRGVSADGSVIVGELRGATGSESFRWTADLGIVGLGALPRATQSIATDVSADGSVVVGTSGGRAFRWSAASGMQELPFSKANSVSADGSVVVGEVGGGSGAIVWTMSGARSLESVLIAFGLDPDGWSVPRATGVSDDGLVVVGYGHNPTGGFQGWRLTLPEPTTAACDNGIDDDGDGVADFPADPGCADSSDSSERGTAACDDGFDDDADGLADFPADPGCENPSDLSERGTAVCDNGIDEDSDGLADFPADAGCLDLNDDSELSTVQCDNGLDDDRDGKIDWRGDGSGDPDCVSLADTIEDQFPWSWTWGCGMGPELAALLPALLWLRRRAKAPRDLARLIRW